MMGKTMDTVKSPIVQPRTDVTDEVSAICREIRDHFEQLRSELQEDIAGLGRDMARGFLRVEDTMRTLFEEYVGRRTVIAEGDPAVDEPPGGG
jgi:hypothetical protein